MFILVWPNSMWAPQMVSVGSNLKRKPMKTPNSLLIASWIKSVRDGHLVTAVGSEAKSYVTEYKNLGLVPRLMTVIHLGFFFLVLMRILNLIAYFKDSQDDSRKKMNKKIWFFFSVVSAAKLSKNLYFKKKKIWTLLFETILNLLFFFFTFVFYEETFF